MTNPPGAGDQARAWELADLLDHTSSIATQTAREVSALLRRLAAAPATDPLDGEEVEATLIDCCQLLDGWHQDGTAWSAWDESVRQRIGKLLHAVYERNRERGIRATAYTPPAATPLTGASDEASGRAGEDGR